MPVNLKAIAKMANVSVATVSRLINNKAAGNMTPETYKKIKEIIEKTNYTPHALAAGLRIGLLKVIDVIFPSNINPYYAQFGHAIENECFKRGYLTFVCNTDSNAVKERDYIRLLISQRVTGIILCSTGLSNSEIKSVLPHIIRVILLDEEIDNFQGDIVIGNDFNGGYIGAKYLFELGHRNILVVLGPEKLGSCRDRLNGFYKFLEEKGIKFNKNLLINGGTK